MYGFVAELGNQRRITDSNVTAWKCFVVPMSLGWSYPIKDRISFVAKQ